MRHVDRTGKAEGERGPGRGGGWGLTVLRLGVGAVFLAHGLQKFVLWGWGGGADVFADAGIPLARASSVAVSLVESLGGAALLVGFLTRYAAAALAVVMAVALVVVHLPHGFFLPGGIEFVLVLGLACVALVLDGGGLASVDRVRERGGTVRSRDVASDGIPNSRALWLAQRILSRRPDDSEG